MHTQNRHSASAENRNRHRRDVCIFPGDFIIFAVTNMFCRCCYFRFIFQMAFGISVYFFVVFICTLQHFLNYSIKKNTKPKLYFFNLYINRAVCGNNTAKKIIHLRYIYTIPLSHLVKQPLIFHPRQPRHLSLIYGSIPSLNHTLSLVQHPYDPITSSIPTSTLYDNRARHVYHVFFSARKIKPLFTGNPITFYDQMANNIALISRQCYHSYME